jgi:outer membrane murein-binding lipoprotein Lpp
MLVRRQAFEMQRRLLGMLVIGGIFGTGSANAESPTPELDKVDRMQRQVEQLQEQVKQVKKDLVEAKKKAAEANAAAPAFEGAYAAEPARSRPANPLVAAPIAIITMPPASPGNWGNRPTICTPDQLNCISLTSRLHLDVGGYNYRPDTGRGLASNGVPIQPATVPQALDDGVNVRRARIGVIGKFMGDWNYNLTYDFGGSSDGFGGLAPGSLPGGGASGVEYAWLSYTGFSKWTGLTGFAIEGGITDVLYTLDNATNSNDIMFMERASAANVATNIAAGDFRSAAGLRGWSDWSSTPRSIHKDLRSAEVLIGCGPHDRGDRGPSLDETELGLVHVEIVVFSREIDELPPSRLGLGRGQGVDPGNADGAPCCAAGKIDHRRGPGSPAEAPAQRGDPIHIARSRRHREVRPARIAFIANEPPRRELPVVARVNAAADGAGIVRSQAARSDGGPCAAEVCAEINAGPVEG